MHKFQKRVGAKSDEDFKEQALSMLQQLTDANQVTKGDVLVYKGKVQAAAEDLCKNHNVDVMADSKKRKASAEAKSPDPASKRNPNKKRRMTLADAAGMDDDEDVSNLQEHVSARPPPKQAPPS